MGQRANMVVVRDGDWRLYYDHWCANRLDVELFWGPQPAVDFIEQLPAADGSAWLDEVWCEGAAIVDMDRKVLLFFGGDHIAYDVPLRRAQLALMTATWPGWDIRWAHEGLVTVGSYLDLPTAQFLTDYRPEPEDRFRVSADEPDIGNTLLTIVRHGEQSARRVSGSQDALWLGPDHLGVLEEVRGQRTMVWSDEMPTGGVHLDFDARALSFWWADWAPTIEERTAGAWPGWSVEWLADRYETHLALAGLDIRMPQRPLADIQGDFVASLQRWCHWPAENPAQGLAERLGALVNPPTKESRGSVGDPAAKQDLLSDLERRLPIGAP